MNPENRLSIDPYVESGGILGERLEVKSSTTQLLSGIELQRDVEVSVFDFDKATNQDVMGLDLSSRSVLSSGGNWSVGILDNRIARDAEEWMRDNYSRYEGIRGKELFERRYVGQLNEEIFKGVKKAAGLSRNEREDGIRAGLKGTYALLGIGAVTFILGGQQLTEHFLDYSAHEEEGKFESYAGVVVGLFELVVAGAAGLVVKDKLDKTKSWREKANIFVPNFEKGLKNKTEQEFRNFDGEFVELKPHLISRSSTSNIRSASGGMTSPAPSSPYPMV